MISIIGMTAAIMEIIIMRTTIPIPFITLILTGVQDLIHHTHTGVHLIIHPGAIVHGVTAHGDFIHRTQQSFFTKTGMFIPAMFLTEI